MRRPDQHNGGAFCSAKRVTGNNTVAAAGSGDNTEVDGIWIDRLISTQGMAMSAKLCMNYTAVLGNSGETLKFGVTLQDADDAAGTGAADVDGANATIAQTTAATAQSGGSTEVGVAEVDVDLAKAKRYIRFQITPNLSAAAADSAAWSAIAVMFGGDRGPATGAIGNIGGPEI